MEEKRLNTVQLVWELMKYKPLLYTMNGILWVLVHLFPLIPALITREFYDILEGKSQLNTDILGVIILFISFTLARIIVIISGFYTDATHRFTIAALLRRNVMKHILSLPGTQAISCTTGEVVTNLREDVEEIVNSISWLLDVIGTITFATSSIVILFMINAKITLFVFLPLTVVVAFAHLASKKVHKFRKEARGATAMVTSSIGEMFNSIQTIKATASEEYVLDHLKTLNKKRHRLMLKDTLFQQILNAIFFNTVNLGTGFILLLSAQSMKDGTFSVGDFSLFVTCLFWIADFTYFWGFFIAKYQQTTVSFNRLRTLLKGGYDEELVKHHPLYLNKKPPKPIYQELKEEDEFKTLEIKDLTYIYPESNKGIKNINFEIKKGDFVVIAGRIGSGKTTLLRTLLGLLTKQTGEIIYNEREIRKPDDFFIYPIVSYTPQIPKLFSESAKNNILLGLNEDNVDIEKACYQAVFELDIKSLSNGLDTLIGPRGVKLSGGQIQRVAAARMFVRDSQIYVLDDISSALDVETEHKLWSRLFENLNHTCIAVSNKKIALQKATHIIVLKNGKIESQGTLDSLLKTSQELKEIWK